MRLTCYFIFLMTMPFSIIDDVRNQFPNIETLEQANSFIKKLENVSTPEAEGYQATMIFMKSRFVKFPFTKLKYFNRGKKKLDAVIKQHPENVELRYLRFLLQKEVPKFLGYYKQIDKDFLIIYNNIKQSNLASTLKLKILNNMLHVKDLQVTKKNKINALIKQL